MISSFTTKKQILEKSDKLKFVHQLNFAQALFQRKNSKAA